MQMQISIVYISQEMDAFFKYLKEPHILQDFKSTFDLSAKFKYPQPSEAQKSKYFEDEFNVIFQKFYHYLRANLTLPGKNDQEVEHNIKSKVDQSDLVIEFDSWLEQEANQFSFAEKPKQTIQPMHSNYSNPTTAPTSKYPITPTTTIRNVENKILSTSGPFHVQKYPPPPPQSPAASSKILPIVNYQPLLQPQPPVPTQQRAAMHQASMQYITASQPKMEDKDKPLKTRFIEKLSEYMDCPERMCIIKAELSLMTKKIGN